MHPHHVHGDASPRSAQRRPTPRPGFWPRENETALVLYFRELARGSAQLLGGVGSMLPDGARRQVVHRYEEEAELHARLWTFCLSKLPVPDDGAASQRQAELYPLGVWGRLFEGGQDKAQATSQDRSPLRPERKTWTETDMPLSLLNALAMTLVFECRCLLQLERLLNESTCRPVLRTSASQVADANKDKVRWLLQTVTEFTAFEGTAVVRRAIVQAKRADDAVFASVVTTLGTMGQDLMGAKRDACHLEGQSNHLKVERRASQMMSWDL